MVDESRLEFFFLVGGEKKPKICKMKTPEHTDRTDSITSTADAGGKKNSDTVHFNI